VARWGKAISTIAVGALLVSACGFGVTGSNDELTDVSARLSGLVGNTKADTTQWWFQYGPTTAYGKTTPRGSVTVTDPSSQYPVHQVVGGLVGATTYHYRLCTTGSDGAGVCGHDATFTTTHGHDSVTGSGVVADLGFGAVWGASVYALGDDDQAGPATGHAVISPGSVYFKIADSGPVTCLRIIGDRAAIGFIADPVDLGQPDPTPIPRVLYVEDNGPTGDRIGFSSLSPPYSECPAPNDASFPNFAIGGVSAPPVLVSGDFTMHDANQ
jgi:hypothetical protein